MGTFDDTCRLLIRRLFFIAAEPLSAQSYGPLQNQLRQGDGRAREAHGRAQSRPRRTRRPASEAGPPRRVEGLAYPSKQHIWLTVGYQHHHLLTATSLQHH